MSNQNITTWQFDPTHSNVEFSVRHLMISTVKGRFGVVSGTVRTNDDDPTDVSVDITIDASSIDTRMGQRDDHLRSPDFFNVAEYPTLRFVSKRVEGDTNDEFKLIGDLTIRDVTREVVLEVSNEGTGNDPWGNFRAGFAARTKFNRTDFGLTWNQALEAGGVLVSEEVKVSLDVQFVRAAAAVAA
jgi:polyisoprenoid-binding protein YceI